MPSKPGITGNPRIIYLGLLSAHLALVWSLSYFPTLDGPTHVYNLVILRDLLHGGRIWGDYYSFLLRPLPNLGFTIITYPLLTFFSPFVAEKIFLSVYIILMGISVPVFIRSFGKPAFPASFFVFPVVFNVSLTAGFYSYCISIPLLLLAISSFRCASDGTTIRRFIVINTACIFLFFFHLIAFAIFLAALAAFALDGPSTRTEKIQGLLLTLGLAAPSILCLLSIFFSETTLGNMRALSHQELINRLPELISDLITFSMVNYFRWQMYPASIVASIFLVLLLTSFIEVSGEDQTSKPHVRSERPLIVLASILFLIYILAPGAFGGGSLFNLRLPWVIFLTLLPILRMPDLEGFQKYGHLFIGSLVAAFFALNIVVMVGQTVKMEMFLRGLRTDPWPRGSVLMTYKKQTPPGTRVDVLSHAASYYGIEKECVDAGNYQASLRLFLVRFKRSLPSMPSEYQMTYKPETIDLAVSPSIRYMIAWEIGNSEGEMIGKYYDLIWKSDNLTIWRRRGLP